MMQLAYPLITVAAASLTVCLDGALTSSGDASSSSNSSTGTSSTAAAPTAAKTVAAASRWDSSDQQEEVLYYTYHLYTIILSLVDEVCYTSWQHEISFIACWAAQILLECSYVRERSVM
jgi:hypothetical protein